MTDLQFLPKASITSNSNFVYKDTTTNAKENRIKLSEDTIELRHNVPIHLQKHNAIKEIETDTYSAFDKAVSETFKTEDYQKTKYQIVEGKREVIEGIVKERNKMIKERLEQEKQDLKTVLERIIRDALKFTKENNPINSMMPTKLTKTINQIKEKRGIAGNLLNISNLSNNSINLSFRTNASTGSVKKYESNQFLKALGLDLLNLNPNNIKIDIDMAYDFIKRWKVKPEDIKKVIRFKVVNEIMNVEERRSVHKIEKMSSKINRYLEHKKFILKKRNSSSNSYSIDNNKSNSVDKEKIRQSLGKNGKSQIRAKTPSKNKFIVINDNSKVKNHTQNKNKSPDLPNSRNSVTCKSIKNLPLPISKSKSAEKRYSSTNNIPNFKNRKGNKIGDECQKKKIIYNAYKNVDKIVNYINDHDEIRDNECLFNHFSNIKYNKNLDDLTKKLINRNKINVIDFSSTQSSSIKI